MSEVRVYPPEGSTVVTRLSDGSVVITSMSGPQGIPGEASPEFISLVQDAVDSAGAAALSEQAASDSAAAALSSETNAGTSESNASGSAAAALLSEGAAADSAAAALASEQAAALSESAAAGSAGTASSDALSASSSAGAASSSAAAALASEGVALGAQDAAELAASTVTSMTVGTTTTSAPGGDAAVVDSGAPGSPVLEFTIPRGTAGPTGDPGAAATIDVGTVTTGAAGSAASVTNVGTSAAAILDMTIPKGDKGDQGIAGVSTGQVLFLDDTASGVGAYNSLPLSPVTGTAEVADSVAVTSAAEALIEGYITPAGFPGVTVLPSGIWTASVYALTSSTGSGTVTRVKAYLYSRTVGGVETLIGSGQSDPLTTSALLYDINIVALDQLIADTDRIVVKFYAVNSSATSRTVTIYHNGTTRYSHLQTPLAGAGGGAGLPDQTGNAGKVLGTDGTDPAWVEQTGGGGGYASSFLFGGM